MITINFIKDHIAHLKRYLNQLENERIKYMVDNGITQCCFIEDRTEVTLEPKKRATKRDNGLIDFYEKQIAETEKRIAETNLAELRDIQKQIYSHQAKFNSFFITEELTKLRAKAEKERFNLLKSDYSCYNIKVTTKR